MCFLKILAAMDLGSFIAVMFGVFGLYGAVLGILQIRDMLRQSAPRTSAH